MKRVAIATYIDNTENMVHEFNWLYRSWLYSGAWRMSEIVAFHHPLIDMSRLPTSDIRYVPLTPFTEREPYWGVYPFINSVEFLTNPAAIILAEYPFTLKTDNDCFLTPYFSEINPRLAMFGMGRFASDQLVVAQLALISKKYGFPFIHNNVGSSLYAESGLVVNHAHQQLNFCKKLREEEFPNGPGEWPHWYFGVLSMYAGQLAANNIFGYNMTLGGLDCYCGSDNEIRPGDFHIHAWHTFDDFSKFKWREGKYRDIDLSKLNKTKIFGYCLWLAGGGPCE